MQTNGSKMQTVSREACVDEPTIQIWEAIWAMIGVNPTYRARAAGREVCSKAFNLKVLGASRSKAGGAEATATTKRVPEVRAGGAVQNRATGTLNRSRGVREEVSGSA